MAQDLCSTSARQSGIINFGAARQVRDDLHALADLLGQDHDLRERFAAWTREVMEMEKPITLRLPDEMLERIDELVPKVASRGDFRAMSITRSSVIRLALVRGLEGLQSEFGEDAPETPVTTVEADLKSGRFRHADIARRHGITRQRVSAKAKQMRERGEL